MCSAFPKRSQAVGKAKLELLSLCTRSGFLRAEKQKHEGSKGCSPADYNEFQVETRSWTIREEVVDFLNSGSSRTHFRWRLILLSVSERKCCLMLSLVTADWITPKLFGHLNYQKEQIRILPFFSLSHTPKICAKCPLVFTSLWKLKWHIRQKTNADTERLRWIRR